MSIKGVSRLAVAGIVSVLSACGSGSNSPAGVGSAAISSHSPAESAALARYVERADALCRAGNAAIAPINERGAEIQRRLAGAPEEPARLLPVLHEGLRVYHRFLRHFERIAAPPGSSAQLDTIIGGLRKVGVDIERLLAAVQRGEPARVKAITSEREIDHARVAAEELEFGFKACGQPAAQSAASG